MMNTILEEEELEYQEAAINKLSISVPAINLIDFARSQVVCSPVRLSNLDELSKEDSVEEDTPNISEDSSSPMRRKERIASVKPNNSQGEFPILVKGLDVEAAHARLSSINSEAPKFLRSFTTGSKGDPNIIRQSSAEIDGVNWQNVIDMYGVGDLYSDTSQSSLQSDFSDIKVIPMESGEGMYNVRNMNQLIQANAKQIPLEELIIRTIHDQESLSQTPKVSFWSKLGFSDKKKEQELMQLVIDDWNNTEELLRREKKKQQGIARLDLQYELEQYKDRTRQEMANKTQTKQTLQKVKHQIGENKIGGIQSNERLQVQIHLHKENMVSIEKRLEKTQKAYSKRILQRRELEEKYKMQIEDLRNKLLTLISHKSEAAQRCEENYAFLEQLHEEKEKLAILNKRIDYALVMLRRSLEFFSKSADHVQFNVRITQTAFCDALNSLKTSSHQAMDGYKEFEKQATTDPRDLMPYTRASERIPGTTGRVGSLLKKNIHSTSFVGN